MPAAIQSSDIHAAIVMNNSNRYRDLIKRHWTVLVRSIDFDGGLLNGLWTEGITIDGLTIPDATPRTTNEKKEKLLRALCDLTSDDVDKFIVQLRLHSQGHVADVLESKLPGRLKSSRVSAVRYGRRIPLLVGSGFK